MKSGLLAVPLAAALLASALAGARLRVVDLEGRTQLLAVELDPHDWPSVLLRRTDSGWERVGEGRAAP